MKEVRQDMFHYRGYYYDVETGFYYMGSRYYDPEVGRLVSASGLFLTPTAAITASFFGGCMIDGAVQLATYKNGDFESFKPNMKNILKTGIQTAIGAAVPGYGNAREVLDDAIGTAIIWAEASIGITCADIIRTIRKETKKPKINSYVYTVYNGSRVVARLSR